MNRILFFKCKIALLGIVFLLSAGCSTHSWVTVHQEKEFLLFAKSIPDELHKRGILDAHGAYVETLFPQALQKNTGRDLLLRLSPSFRYDRKEEAPKTFARTVGPNDTIRTYPGGFQIYQGQTEVAVSILASVDWNRDGNEDWILLCRVKTAAKAKCLEYYLCVPPKPTGILTPRLLAVRETINTRRRFDNLMKSSRRTISFEPTYIEMDTGTAEVLPTASANVTRDEGNRSRRLAR
ncbi:MAG: hypothetical protein PUB69_02930 [Desulfovibrionaceae bacterium]|nr:hypothetical protein [Desulfovibrionaceae bacterium]